MWVRLMQEGLARSLGELRPLTQACRRLQHEPEPPHPCAPTHATLPFFLALVVSPVTIPVLSSSASAWVEGEGEVGGKGLGSQGDGCPCLEKGWGRWQAQGWRHPGAEQTGPLKRQLQSSEQDKTAAHKPYSTARRLAVRPEG